MGRMKEVYIQMLDEEYQGDPSLYLKDQMQRLYEGFTSTDITCPNCLKDKLMSDSKDEGECHSCGQEFIFIENTIRFK